MIRGLVWGASAALALGACGDASSSASASWAGAHPNPPSMSFLDQSAAGFCAVTARYPTEAPAAINLRGATYVQHDRDTVGAGAHGVELDHSGDWHIYQQSDGRLLLTDPLHTYTYIQANC